MKIELNEAEVFHIMDALDMRIEILGDLEPDNNPMIRDEIAELTELTDDLREAWFRRNDDWDPDRGPDSNDDQRRVLSRDGSSADTDIRTGSFAAARRQKNLTSS
jgi:hypothetical protein